MSSCVFCGEQKSLARNEHAFMIYDRWPVTPGHLLIVTARHVEDFFKTTAAERQAILRLLDRARLLLDETYSPQGYNIGINIGETAGQTVMHVHLHVIPRYRGDTPNPRGGVRGVIPGKQAY